MSNRPEVTIHRYPVQSVAADYLRAAAGMALTLGPIVFFNLVVPMVYILGGLGALFLVFGIRTLLRHLTSVEVSAEGVTMAIAFDIRETATQSFPWARQSPILHHRRNPVHL